MKFAKPKWLTDFYAKIQPVDINTPACADCSPFAINGRVPEVWLITCCETFNSSGRVARVISSTKPKVNIESRTAIVSNRLGDDYEFKLFGDIDIGVRNYRYEDSHSLTKQQVERLYEQLN